MYFTPRALQIKFVSSAPKIHSTPTNNWLHECRSLPCPWCSRWALAAKADACDGCHSDPGASGADGRHTVQFRVCCRPRVRGAPLGCKRYGRCADVHRFPGGVRLPSQLNIHGGQGFITNEPETNLTAERVQSPEKVSTTSSMFQGIVTPRAARAPCTGRAHTRSRTRRRCRRGRSSGRQPSRAPVCVVVVYGSSTGVVLVVLVAV